MKKITYDYFCDLCNRRIPFDDIRTVSIGHMEEGYEIPATEKTYHFHVECIREILDFETLEGEDESETEF